MSLVRIYDMELIGKGGVFSSTKRGACNQGRDMLGYGPIDVYCALPTYFNKMCKEPWMPLKETLYGNTLSGYGYTANTLLVLPYGRIYSTFPPELFPCSTSILPVPY